MATPGLGSRLRFRLMAAVMAVRRGSVATEERVRRSGVAVGQTVLDFACGPGHFTVVAARIVGPTGRVYGLDVQPAAAGMVATRAQRTGLGNVTTITSDCATGLPTSSVDVVLLYDAIHAIADKRAVLDEIERVLKPGGRLSVWVEHGPPEATLPLITTNSRFVLQERRGDILNFGTGEDEVAAA